MDFVIFAVEIMIFSIFLASTYFEFDLSLSSS